MRSSEITCCSSSTVLVAIVFIISCSIFLPVDANNVGFSTELIHRDSPLSPLFNPNLSHFKRLEIAVQRSLIHIEQIGSTNLIPDAGEYLMKISFGRPPVEFLLLLDTGSALSWIQCEPCIKCYPSEYQPFHPKISRTFQYVMCSNKACPYELKYEDKSYSRGELARETITVGSGSQKVSFPNFLFGCGHDNVGIFPYKGAGVVGFGPKPNSFVTQLSSLHHGKFSYCLAPATSTPGRINFGDEAVVSGPGVVSTPLMLDSHYYLMLEGVTVGAEKLKYFHDHQLHFSSNDSRKVGNGGRILIDSGSTVIFLPHPLLSQVEGLLRRLIKLKPKADPKKHFNLCYPSSLRNGDIPKITFHFTGANVVPSPLSTFVQNTASSRCLAIMPTKSIPIFGNLAQTNYLIGYDLVSKKVSFKQTDCTRHSLML